MTTLPEHPLQRMASCPRFAMILFGLVLVMLTACPGVAEQRRLSLDSLGGLAPR